MQYVWMIENYRSEKDKMFREVVNLLFLQWPALHLNTFLVYFFLHLVLYNILFFLYILFALFFLCFSHPLFNQVDI